MSVQPYSPRKQLQETERRDVFGGCGHQIETTVSDVNEMTIVMILRQSWEETKIKRPELQ